MKREAAYRNREDYLRNKLKYLESMAESAKRELHRLVLNDARGKVRMSKMQEADQRDASVA